MCHCRYFAVVNVEHNMGAQLNEVDVEYDVEVELLNRNDP